MPESQQPEKISISWFRSDPEQKLLFRGGRFTRVNNSCSFLLAAVGTVLFYLALIPFQTLYISQMFTHRGPVPYFIVGFSCWSLAILILKSVKLRLQRSVLTCQLFPQFTEFILSPTTAGEVTQKMCELVDDPRHFVLYNRIEIALANLKNLGRVSDLDEILRSQGEQDEAVMETSYALLSGFVWAIPVLGFIGTVQGLSQSIGGFGAVLATTQELSQIKLSLQGVTGGLAVAFETTLQGLVAALIIQLLLTYIKNREEEFLNDCSEYCVRNIVGRLRLTPYQRDDVP